jgi:hypothetical protein
VVDHLNWGWTRVPTFSRNMRLAVWLAFLVLIVGDAGRMAPNHEWGLWGQFFLANLAISLADRLWAEWQIRRYVRALRSLDPVRTERILKNMFWTPARQLYADRLQAEGQMESDGLVEHFPFSVRDRRENTILFWFAVATTVLVLAAEFTPHAPRPILAGVAVAVLIPLLVWLRRVEKKLATVIVVSPFSIAEVHPDGRKRSLVLDGAMELRLNRRRSRVELSALGDREFIALDFGRLGFERLLDRVLDYGGFRAERDARKASSAAETSESAGPETLAPTPSGPLVTWKARWRSIRRRAARGAATVVPLATAVALVRVESGSRTRHEHFDRITVDASRLAAQRAEYASWATGPYGVESEERWNYVVIPCTHENAAAWCLVTGIDTTVFGRDSLEPLYSNSGAGMEAYTTVYAPDSVRTNYVINVAYSDERIPRQVTVARRPEAWPEGFPSELLLALASPGTRSLIPLQPKTDMHDDVERTTPDEDRTVVNLLNEDTAVVWVQGRDSGVMDISSVQSVLPLRLQYRASILHVSYPDRTVILWVSDSLHLILRRETRPRVGLIGSARVDSLVGMDRASVSR